MIPSMISSGELFWARNFEPYTLGLQFFNAKGLLANDTKLRIII